MGDDERGVNRVAAHAGLVRARQPQARADEEEQGELGDDEHTRADQGALGILEIARGEQALNDEMVGAV